LKSLLKKTRLFSLLLISVTALQSCVEPYVQSFTTSNKIIIVEGLLANDIGLRPILLKESLPSTDGGVNVNVIIGAKVSVLINGKTTVTLAEKSEGKYYFDDAFKGVLGSTYQLKFTTPDGNTFESKVEALDVAVPIQAVFHQLDTKAITDAKGNTSAGYKLYVDVKDPAGTPNQYMWEWTVYEKQNVCQTCVGGYYYRTPAPYGACVEDALLKRYGNIFDYLCENNCWEIIRSSELAANNDELYDGKTIKAQFVGKMPIYQYSGALLDIDQYSISKQAYNFIKLSQKQGIETGGLADTPPAALTGNIVCTNNPAINTSGYFIVAGKSRSQYWLDRKDLLNTGIPMVGLLGGRAAKYEPAGPNTTRPPLAPCIKSLNRTNQQPAGWIN
jgi:hypothetical protein